MLRISHLIAEVAVISSCKVFSSMYSVSSKPTLLSAMCSTQQSTSICGVFIVDDKCWIPQEGIYLLLHTLWVNDFE